MRKIQSKFSGAFSAEIDDLTHYLRQQSDIKLAILFGSLATGKARLDSDIDIGIQKKNPLSAGEKAETFIACHLLKAVEGGVLVRAGHTEACVDFMKLAKLKPAGIICEILNENGFP